MSAPFGNTQPKHSKRTGQPVRRRSFHRGEREHHIWRPLGPTKKDAWRFHWALIAAAKRYDDSTKQPGAHMGELGLTGVKVLEVLLGFADKMSGRLEPAIDTIAAKAKLARGTVVRALARLKAAGFLDWYRRTEPVESEGDEPQAGPQVRQIPNAYWFALRGRAAGLVRLILGKAPPDTPSSQDVDAQATASRNARLHAMQGRAKVTAPPLSPETRAAFERLREKRSASIKESQNPGLKG